MAITSNSVREKGITRMAYYCFTKSGYGFTDYFSISTGLFPLVLLEEKPALFGLSSKFSYPIIKDRLYIGGNGLLSTVTGDGGETFGFYNGSVTYGSIRNNVMTGIGQLYWDEGWEKACIFIGVHLDAHSTDKPGFRNIRQAKKGYPGHHPYYRHSFLF